MKILLDTTYFLPGFGVSIDPLQRNVLIKIIALPKINEVFISEILFFEIAAKVSKKASQEGCTDLDEHMLILQDDNQYTVIPSTTRRLWSIACFLRKYHNDYIDCIHWSSALLFTDAFITEDKVIEKLAKQSQLIHQLKVKYGIRSIPVYNSKSLFNLMERVEKLEEESNRTI